MPEDKHVNKMRRFLLKRNQDETGISGTGIVAEGVKFSNGECCLNWLSDTRSLGIYRSTVELLHIHGHSGKTEIVFIDDLEEM